MSLSRRKELQDLLQYMAPGTTIEDMLEDDSEDDDDMAYDLQVSKSGSVAVKATGAATSNPQQAQSSMSKMQPHQHTVNASVLSRIRVDDYDDDGGGGGGGGSSGGQKMNQKVLNELREATIAPSEQRRKT
jgi:RIO kinase 1